MRVRLVITLYPPTLDYHIVSMLAFHLSNRVNAITVCFSVTATYIGVLSCICVFLLPSIQCMLSLLRCVWE